MSLLRPSGLKAPTKIPKHGSWALKAPSAGTAPVPPPSAPSSETQEEFVDDFQVGERVWVKGNKPGFIQFLGETQFAPGQWAGIILDEALGKNDGSVAGVRYFQCEPLKGIFTRPSKLSRSLQADDETNGLQPAPAARATPPLSASPAPAAAPNAPQPSAKEAPATPHISNLTRTASESISNLSEAGSLKNGEQELKLGDRVLVGGVKAGVVRFLGETNFAKGDWCGVELEKPLGKNDGAMAGTRYFQCQPKYGLFVRIHKVTKIGFPSTTPAKAKSAPVRGVMATTPTSLKRHSSASSLSSVSSVTSSVSSRPSRTGLHVLELEAKMDELQAMHEATDWEKVELNQLEEEKRKVEDLQFCVEEESITKGDLEFMEILFSHQKEVESLKAQLAAERAAHASELQTLRSRLFRMAQDQKNSLEAARAKLDQTEDQHLVEMEDALKKLQEAETKVKHLEGLRAMCSQQAQALADATAQLEATQQKLLQLDGLRKASSEGKLEMEKLRQQLQVTERQIQELDNAKATESGSLAEELQGKELALRSLQENLNEAGRVKEALEKELRSLREKVDVSRSQSQALQAEHAKSTTESQAQHAEAPQALQKLLLQAEEKLQAVQAQNGSLLREVAELKTQADKAKSLTYLFSSAKQEIELMSEYRRALRSENELLAKEKLSLKSERGALVLKLKEAEAKNSSLQEEQTKLWLLNQAIRLDKAKVIEARWAAEKLCQQERLGREALEAEKEKVLEEGRAVQEELQRVGAENYALQAAKLGLQALVEELQMSKSGLVAECKKGLEERGRLEEHVKKLVLENVSLAKDKDIIIQKLQCSYEELARDQKSLVKEIKELKAEMKSALEKQSALEAALQEARDAARSMEKTHASVLQAKEALDAERQEECRRLEADRLAAQQALAQEREARAKETQAAAHEASQLRGRLGLLEQEAEELRTLAQGLQAERLDLLEEKARSDQKVAEILREKELLSADAARLAADIKTLKGDFAALSRSKLELQGLNSCLPEILAELQHKHEAALAERAQAGLENENLLAEKRELQQERAELLQEKEQLAGSYFLLQKEVSRLTQTSSHVSASLLEAQKENRVLRKDKIRLAFKIRELEMMLSFTAVQTAEDARLFMDQLSQERTETLASLEDTRNTNAKLQSEVDFLNSVIVDLQGKNRDLKMKEEMMSEAALQEGGRPQQLNNYDNSRFGPATPFSALCRNLQHLMDDMTVYL